MPAALDDFPELVPWIDHIEPVHSKAVEAVMLFRPHRLNPEQIDRRLHWPLPSHQLHELKNS